MTPMLYVRPEDVLIDIVKSGQYDIYMILSCIALRVRIISNMYIWYICDVYMPYITTGKPRLETH